VTRVLVDGHGGDEAPKTVVDALRLVLDGPSGLELGIVGLPEILKPALQEGGLEGRVELVAAEQVIDMCESPVVALRRKKESSIHVGTRKVRDGQWDAFVSAGNTGALMAVAKMILKTLPGVDRPAIASVIPAIGGCTLLLDCGANVDCSSENLVQFAVMGSCYMQAAEGIESPRVGLLNIGTEAIKGTDVVKVAATALAQTDLNFIGNVEGTDIFLDTTDVVVCDGFVGNVALKTMEGAAHFILHHLRHELAGSLSARLGMLFSRGAMRRFKADIDPSEHNGAPLLGLNGIVVKSHGSADARAFAKAILVARREVEAGLSRHIIKAMSQWVVD